MAKSKFAVNAEYAALRFFCGIVNLVPYGCACLLARLLARGAFAAGFKRRRTLDRIRSVFPAISAREAKRIAVSSLENVLQTAVEMIRAPKLTREWMDRHVTEGPRYKAMLQEIVDRGHGAVIMVPHSGNWYMAAWAMAKYGLPLFAIAARQRNPKIDAWMNRQYGDIEVLDRDCRDTLGKIKTYLGAGRAFAILPDLRVRKRDVDAEFLGGRANVSHAGAMFAVHAHAPIVVAAMTRENGRHVINYLATLDTDGRTAADLTREAMKLLSDFVTAHPGDWYWYNKRWILEPVDPRGL